MNVAHDSFLTLYTFFSLFYMTMIVTIPRSLLFFFSFFDKPVSANGGRDGRYGFAFYTHFGDGNNWGAAERGGSLMMGGKIWGKKVTEMVVHGFMVMATLLRMASNGWRRKKRG